MYYASPRCQGCRGLSIATPALKICVVYWLTIKFESNTSLYSLTWLMHKLDRHKGTSYLLGFASNSTDAIVIYQRQAIGRQSFMGHQMTQLEIMRK